MTDWKFRKQAYQQYIASKIRPAIMPHLINIIGLGTDQKDQLLDLVTVRTNYLYARVMKLHPILHYSIENWMMPDKDILEQT